VIIVIVVYFLITMLVVIPFHYTVKGSTIHDIQNNRQNLVVCDTSPRTLCDKNGLAYQDYGTEIGIQLNPLRTASKALDYYMDYTKSGNETAKKFLLNIANWIVDSSKNLGNYSLLKYEFAYPDYKLEPGWHSAIAQGRAIEALIRAHNITGDEKYIATAKMLLNSFFIEVKFGGVTYKTDDEGWWYEEYPSKNKGAINPRVLNGMMSALLSIYEYFNYTRDPMAKYLFDQGILALENSLPHYNNKGYSYYDILGNDAKPNYHQLHVKYLGILYDITGKPTFKNYHDIWKEWRGKEKEK
jgi:heparosan-N-sulfate-glucuronate 5-epimerase